MAEERERGFEMKLVADGMMAVFMDGEEQFRLPSKEMVNLFRWLMFMLQAMKLKPDSFNIYQDVRGYAVLSKDLKPYLATPLANFVKFAQWGLQNAEQIQFANMVSDMAENHVLDNKPIVSDAEHIMRVYQEESDGGG